jgi:spermidine synthase
VSAHAPSLSSEEIARGEFHCHRMIEPLFEGRTRFQKVDIVRTEGYGRGLFLDGRIQHVEVDEYIYSESMVHPAMALLGKAGRRVLCIGGGPGGIVRELIKYHHVTRVVQVEIDEEILHLSRRYLSHVTQGAWEDPRVRIVIDDALQLLQREEEEFDLIINDASEPLRGSPAMDLFTTEGFSLYKRRLHPRHGLFVTWAGAAGPASIARAARIVETVRNVFPHVECYLSHPQSYGTSWLTVLGSPQPLHASRRKPYRIDAFLAEALREGLRLYDGLTHRHMFTLPGDVRRALSLPRSPITREHPLDFELEVSP